MSDDGYGGGGGNGFHSIPFHPSIHSFIHSYTYNDDRKKKKKKVMDKLGIEPRTFSMFVPLPPALFLVCCE